MTKFGCSRQSSGRFKRSNNGNKVIKVYLENGIIKEMLKSELDSLLESNAKRTIYQAGLYIIVEEKVYRVIKQEEWREAKRKERNQKANEISREKTADSNIKVSAHNETLVGDFCDNAEIANKVTESPEERLINQERLDALYEVLATLSARDREIIQLFSLKYTDAKIGERIGMSQRGVNKRKKAILAQMKKLLDKIL